MKNMRNAKNTKSKILSAIILSALMLSACGNSDDNVKESKSDVTTDKETAVSAAETTAAETDKSESNPDLTEAEAVSDSVPEQPQYTLFDTVWLSYEANSLYEYKFSENTLECTYSPFDEESGLFSTETYETEIEVTDSYYTVKIEDNDYISYYRIKDGVLQISSIEFSDNSESDSEQIISTFYPEDDTVYSGDELLQLLDGTWEYYDSADDFVGEAIDGKNMSNRKFTWTIDTENMMAYEWVECPDGDAWWESYYAYDLFSCDVATMLLHGGWESDLGYTYDEDDSYLYDVEFVNVVDKDTAIFNGVREFKKSDTKRVPDNEASVLKNRRRVEPGQKSDGIAQMYDMDIYDAAKKLQNLCNEDNLMPVVYSYDKNTTMNLFTSQSDYSLNFNGREFSYGSISYVNDTEKPYSVSFYYSPLNYDVKTSNDRISIKGGKSPDYSECEEFYDGLYSEFKTRYGEPDETYDEDYIYNTWKNTPDGDIWLCKGKNLWSTDGYNDVILTYTKSGFDYSTIRD